MPRAEDRPVRLTRIYAGRRPGETSLGDEARSRSSTAASPLSARSTRSTRSSGLALAAQPPRRAAVLERVQNELFDVGADVSVPFGIADRLRINQAQIDALEAV